MMGLLLLIISSVLVQELIASKSSTCFIDRVDEIDWMVGFTTINKTIDDTYQGPITTYENTKNIIGILKVEDSPYIRPELNGNKLTLYTTKDFENFENVTSGGIISTKLTFNCTNGTSDDLTFSVRVRDLNNHKPVLNQNGYEYKFQMEIPKDFELTTFLPINGTDQDFTNTMITFRIEENDDFIVTNVDPSSKIQFASLKALRNITPPYRREFTLSATDDGNPISVTNVPIIITTTTNTLSTLKFTEMVYFGNYKELDRVQMDVPLKFQRGSDNTTLVRQHDYTEYFNVTYDKVNDELVVTNLQTLPDQMVLQEMLVINIEAETPGITYTGRTTVIIRTDGDIGCSLELLGHSYRRTDIVIGVSVAGVILVIILNILLFGVFYRRKMKRFGFY